VASDSGSSFVSFRLGDRRGAVDLSPELREELATHEARSSFVDYPTDVFA
jgi:hypothetical protein